MSTDLLQDHAKDILSTGKVDCIIGYEVGPRQWTRPVFIYEPDEVSKLVWNQHCAHNLTTYLASKLSEENERVAVVLKPCDAKSFNMLLAENKLDRQQVHIIGMVCTGLLDDDGEKQSRCIDCSQQQPNVYDYLIGDPDTETDDTASLDGNQGFAEIEELLPAERAEFWIEQFDRCIRCYACRQACPSCNCPTCLYERDDALWVGMKSGIKEKRAFHLGRAMHLAGRCVGCNECERVCPMEIPISLLNQTLANELQAQFDYIAGNEVRLSPLIGPNLEKEQKA